MPNKTFGTLKTLRLGTMKDTVRLLPKAGQSVYSSTRWMQLSARIRKAVRWCMVPDCNKRGEYVDHIIELEDGGAPYDPMNLCVLCASHHTRKTLAVRALRTGTDNVFDRLVTAHAQGVG